MADEKRSGWFSRIGDFVSRKFSTGISTVNTYLEESETRVERSWDVVHSYYWPVGERKEDRGIDVPKEVLDSMKSLVAEFSDEENSDAQETNRPIFEFFAEHKVVERLCLAAGESSHNLRARQLAVFALSHLVRSHNISLLTISRVATSLQELITTILPIHPHEAIPAKSVESRMFRILEGLAVQLCNNLDLFELYIDRNNDSSGHQFQFPIFESLMRYFSDEERAVQLLEKLSDSLVILLVRTWKAEFLCVSDSIIGYGTNESNGLCGKIREKFFILHVVKALMSEDEEEALGATNYVAASFSLINNGLLAETLADVLLGEDSIECCQCLARRITEENSELALATLQLLDSALHRGGKSVYFKIIGGVSKYLPSSPFYVTLNNSEEICILPSDIVKAATTLRIDVFLADDSDAEEYMIDADARVTDYLLRYASDESDDGNGLFRLFQTSGEVLFSSGEEESVTTESLFMTALYRRLENFWENSEDINVMLTSVWSRLVVVPFPPFQVFMFSNAIESKYLRNDRTTFVDTVGNLSQKGKELERSSDENSEEVQKLAIWQEFGKELESIAKALWKLSTRREQE